MPNSQNTANGDFIAPENLGEQAATLAFEDHLKNLSSFTFMDDFWKGLDKLEELSRQDKEAIERLGGIATSLEANPRYQGTNSNGPKNGRNGVDTSNDERQTPQKEDSGIKSKSYAPRKAIKRAVPYLAAFALGAVTQALLSEDETSISSSEEALAHYNRTIEAAGGEIVVRVPQGANTPEDICLEAFGRLYAFVDPSPEPEDAEMFIESLIERRLCTDVNPRWSYYRFVPYRETSQPTER